MTLLTGAAFGSADVALLVDVTKASARLSFVLPRCHLACLPSAHSAPTRPRAESSSGAVRGTGEVSSSRSRVCRGVGAIGRRAAARSKSFSSRWPPASPHPPRSPGRSGWDLSPAPVVCVLTALSPSSDRLPINNRRDQGWFPSLSRKRPPIIAPPSATVLAAVGPTMYEGQDASRSNARNTVSSRTHRRVLGLDPRKWCGADPLRFARDESVCRLGVAAGNYPSSRPLAVSAAKSMPLALPTNSGRCGT
jgi:hypothetical protein